MTRRKRTEATTRLIPVIGDPAPAPRFWRGTIGFRRWYTAAPSLAQALAALAPVMPPEGLAINVTTITTSAARRVVGPDGTHLADAPLGVVYTEG